MFYLAVTHGCQSNLCCFLITFKSYPLSKKKALHYTSKEDAKLVLVETGYAYCVNLLVAIYLYFVSCNDRRQQMVIPENVVRIQPFSELCWFIDSSLKSMPGCNCILDYLMNSDTCFEFSMLGSLCAETSIVATPSRGGRRSVCIEIWLYPGVGCWGRGQDGVSMQASLCLFTLY